MPCYPMMQEKARRLGMPLPAGLATDQDIQSMVGARDHEDTHRILDAMTDTEVLELIRKIREKAKRKRAQATEQYIALQAGVR